MTLTSGDRAARQQKIVLIGILLVLTAYAVLAAMQWPQKQTEAIAERSRIAAAEAAVHGESPERHRALSQPACPPLWMVLPFAALLAIIAVFPLIPRLSHWWDSNWHRLYVAGGLGIVTLLYYLLGYEHPVTFHWPIASEIAAPVEGWNWAGAGAVFGNAMLAEYLPFIVLLFGLYTISGGIRIEGDLRAHPLTNTVFLAIGSILANVIGTTGAAMLLIRPLLETNRERKQVRHTVIFFIFIVCNCGGCLLPLGDPPLFLGYLNGVPFLWTLRLAPEWALTNGILLAVYFLWDHWWFYPRESRQDIALDESRVHRLRIGGVWPNAILLLAVVPVVALLDPQKPVAGTDWYPWVFLREAAILGLVAASLILGGSHLRRANRFHFAAIGEVAALFFGIFICMQAPLQILHVMGPSLGLSSPAHFFWAAGGLSSVLDNAPTYAVFFEAAKSLGGSPAVAGVRESLLVAISLGSVFMGAMTYIGNGPNFMVRSIAEERGVPMPSFFGYVVYSGAFLLPVFYVTTLLL